MADPEGLIGGNAEIESTLGKLVLRNIRDSFRN